MDEIMQYSTVHMGDSLTRYRASFEDLGPDHHHPAETGGRTRRLAQYKAVLSDGGDTIDLAKLKTQLFLQGETNKLTGHIEREFEDITIDMAGYIETGYRIVNRMWDLARHEHEWLVNVHMIRVHAHAAIRGVPVPEGIHKDGADYVVMGCVARENVKGGVSQLYEADDGAPVYGVTLMPGDALVVDDRQVFHMVTPLITDDDHGYRDMIIMGFHKWSRGKYRDEAHEDLLQAWIDRRLRSRWADYVRSSQLMPRT